MMDVPSRRDALALATLAAAGLATGAGAAPLPDLDDPTWMVRAYVAMRARLDGRRIYMPYAATIFGKVEGRAAKPLFDVQGFSWATAVETAPGRWLITNTEAGYYCDLVTGEPLDRWINPLNGLECRVKHYRSSQFMEVGPDGLKPVGGPQLPAGAFTADWGRPTVIDGTIWMHENLIGAAPNRPRESFADPLEYVGPTITATSLATWSAPAAALVRPARGFVPVLLSYQTMNSWRPFMRMGPTPGAFGWRMFGKKCADTRGIPAATLARVLADHPDFLTLEPQPKSG